MSISSGICYNESKARSLLEMEADREVISMQYILYFLIAIGATTVGSLTGMGGGVIIKPLMDVMHHLSLIHI